jgi:CBS domain-containing protein
MTTIQRPLAVMMQRALQTIAPEATAREAAKQMRAARVGALLVREGERFVGIVSEADLVRKALAESSEVERVSVRSVMSAPLISIDIARSAHDASDLMAEHGIRHLGVIEDGEVVGMLSVRDLLRYFKNWGNQ